MKVAYESSAYSASVDLCEGCPIAEALGMSDSGYSAGIFRRKYVARLLVTNNSTGATTEEIVKTKNWAAQRNPHSAFNQCSEPEAKRRAIRAGEVSCGALARMKRSELDYIRSELKSAR